MHNRPPTGARIEGLGRASWWVLAVLLGTTVQATPAMAQVDPAGVDGAPVPIPEPRRRPPRLAGEVHLEAVVPVATAPLCPADAACILGAGAGVGGVVERRWWSGVSLGLAYDAWFLNGNGVYEVTVVQSLGALLRQQFLLENMAHPFVGVGVGGVLLGENFGASAAGLALEGHFGVEIEMSPALAVTITTVWRLFVTTSFRTPADGVRRVADQGPNLAATLRLGLVIL
jgi:hypothetical protein